MARTITLTVQVDQGQFNAFATHFTDLSNQIKGLNSQFTQLNSTIQKATASTNTLTNSMRVLSNITKALANTVSGITTHFFKWSVLINGIGSMLGFGGGSFGFDRLAASILQKRRMILGLGGDFGRTQASLIQNQSILNNPLATLTNIRLGMGGSEEQMRPLLAMGINPFRDKLSPDQVLDKLLEKVPELLKNARPGTELMVMKAFGLQNIFDPMDLLRMTTEEGREEIKYRRQKIEEHKGELTLSKEAQRAWTDLEIQLQITKTGLMNTFGEALKRLAPRLEQMSAALLRIIEKVLKSKTVDQILDVIEKGMKWFEEKLDKLSKEDIDEWLKHMNEFMDTMVGLKDTMKKFYDILKWIVDMLTGKQQENAESGSGTSGYYGGTQPGLSYPGTRTPISPGDNPNPKSFSSPDPGFAGPGGPPANFSFKPSVAPAGPSSTSSPITDWMGGANPLTGTGAKTRSLTPTTPNVPIPRGRPSGAPGGRTLPRGVAPPTIPGGTGGDTIMVPAVPGRRSDLGPGHADQWQRTRTSSLVIRNVPGANVFLTGAAMSTG